jgi:hypothetical protein
MEKKKLELKKETDYTGDWYFVLVDGMCRKATQDIEVAKFVYNEIKSGVKTVEIMKSEEI